jgi:hypothetical protein
MNETLNETLKLFLRIIITSLNAVGLVLIINSFLSILPKELNSIFQFFIGLIIVVVSLILATKFGKIEIE